MVITPAGFSKVHLRLGKVVGHYEEGLSLKMPFIDSTREMSIRTQLHEVADATSASKDLQDATTSIAINYRIDSNRIEEIYRTVGEQYIKVIANPAIQETLKATTAKYDAEDLILKREQVKDEITSKLKDRLGERGVIVESVSITNFQFSQEFTKAIESKVVAQQAVLEAENKLRQIEVEARQAEQKAKGEASAAIARAKGQVEAIELLSSALKNNEAYLQYMTIDRLAEKAEVVLVPHDIGLTIPK